MQLHIFVTDCCAHDKTSRLLMHTIVHTSVYRRSSRRSKIPSLPKTPLLKPPLMRQTMGVTLPCQKLAIGVAE